MNSCMHVKKACNANGISRWDSWYQPKRIIIYMNKDRAQINKQVWIFTQRIRMNWKLLTIRSTNFVRAFIQVLSEYGGVPQWFVVWQPYLLPSLMYNSGAKHTEFCLVIMKVSNDTRKREWPRSPKFQTTEAPGTKISSIPTHWVHDKVFVERHRLRQSMFANSICSTCNMSVRTTLRELFYL